MRKTILICGIIGALIILVVGLNPLKQKSPQPIFTPIQQPAQITPSRTLKNYTDPSGFSFNYPDNLSILNNELKDEDSYAELQLVANGLPGSLFLKIADSKLTSLDEWVRMKNSSSEAPKEAKLGNLRALEIKSNDKLMLGALDQGILFTIEVPQGEGREFWIKALNIVMADFSFVTPSSDSTDVTFESEEVVE